MQADQILNLMIKRLITTLNPEKIYLFGSRATGTCTHDSDYDLMVVVPQSNLPRHKRNRIAFRALCGVGASKDVIVLTSQEFEESSQVVCSLVSTVLREGILVHATKK